MEKRKKYIVKLLGKAGMLYSQGNKEIQVDSEIMAGKNGIVINKDSIRKWQKPEVIE